MSTNGSDSPRYLGFFPDFRLPNEASAKPMPMFDEAATLIQERTYTRWFYPPPYGSPFDGPSYIAINRRESDEEFFGKLADQADQKWRKQFAEGLIEATNKPVRLALPKPSIHVPDFRDGGYLDKFVNPELLRERLGLAVRALDGWRNDFDAIAFRGMSGALCGPPVALALDKTMILVRKADDGSHSSHRCEGDAGARSYIILDDFVASGRTKRQIIRDVKTFAPQAECLGLLEVRSLTESYIDNFRGRKFPLHTQH